MQGHTLATDAACNKTRGRRTNPQAGWEDE